MLSSANSTPNLSPKMPSSSPVSIGWPTSSPPSSASASSSFSSTSSKGSATWTLSSSYSGSMSCAFPSWPSRNSLSPTLVAQDSSSSSKHSSGYSYHDLPSAYISDLDLFPEDLDDKELPYLEEAPAPPREYKMPIAMPLLPLYASQRPYGEKRRKSSCKSKARPMGKPMSPILEAPIHGS